MLAPYGTRFHSEPIIHYIGSKPFTQRRFDQIMFLVAYQRFKFETVRRIFELQHGFPITNEDVVEAVEKCGFNFAIFSRKKELWNVVWIDGINLNQKMLDEIIFMALNRKFQYDTIKRFFYLSHKILISERLITQVLLQHDYAVRGPVHRKKNPMNETVARAPIHGIDNRRHYVRATGEPYGRLHVEADRGVNRIKSDNDAYSQYHSYNREVKAQY